MAYDYTFEHKGQALVAVEVFLDNGCPVFDITTEDGEFVAVIDSHPLQSVEDAVTLWRMNQARIETLSEPAPEMSPSPWAYDPANPF